LVNKLENVIQGSNYCKCKFSKKGGQVGVDLLYSRLQEGHSVIVINCVNFECYILLSYCIRNKILSEDGQSAYNINKYI